MKIKLLSFIVMMTKLIFYGTIIQVFTCSLLLALSSDAQMVESIKDKKLDMNLKNVSLSKVFVEMERQTGYEFTYDRRILKSNLKVDLVGKDRKVYDYLLTLSKDANLKFKQYNNNISVSLNDGNDALEPSISIVVQAINITGRIKSSDDGEGLPGVNVIVKGTSTGTVTDVEGNYSIQVPDGNSILTFSSVGYLLQEMPVGTKTIIDISLAVDVKSLEEIVVVGYGTQKKIDVIGSMASIQGEELTKIHTTSVAESLQGMASGLWVSNRSGHPGNAPEIKIRGINSISLSSEPLWIVDGMPIQTSPSENMRDGVKGVSPIAMLNPNDIKSIEVLKDAAATAIYGSRASGGVILVTTKSAEKGMASVSLSYDGGYSKIPFSQNDVFVDSKTWWELSDLSSENLGIVPRDPNSIISTIVMGDQPQMTREEAIASNTDHLGAITHDAVYNQFGLTANKGFENGGAMFSLNYRDEKGLIKNNDFKRLTSRLGFNFKPLKSVEMGINMEFAYLKTNGVRSVGGKSYGGWANWAVTLPWFKIFDETSPTGYWAAGSGYNMQANSDRRLTRYDVDEYRGLVNSFIQWSPLEGLTVRGQVGVDLIANNSSFFRSGLLNPLPPYQSVAEEQTVTKSIYNYTVYANYNKVFSDIHSLDFTIGTEANSDWSYTRKFAGSGLQTAYPELRNPVQMTSMAGYQGGDVSLMGIFARANYKLSDRYLFTASARRDGHSAFSEENRWADFYAVGAGWILTNENFLQDNSLFSLLKLRGSYGTTGNTKVSNSMTYMQWELDTHYNYGVDVSAGSTNVGPLGSADLKWETTTNFDIGIDFGILNDRINGSIAFYTQNIQDLILLGSVQPSVGFNENAIYENAGDMKNLGIEFNISSVNIVKGDFKWNTDFNISTNKNEIISLNETEKGKGRIEATTIRKEGEALNTYFLANYTSIDTEKGIPLIEQRDNGLWNNEYLTTSTGEVIPATAGNVDNNRMIQHGKTSLPTFYGGLNNVLSYKNFDLNILLNFEGGHWLWNDLYSLGWKMDIGNNTINEIVGNTWEKPGDVAEWPQLLDGTGIYYDNEGNPSPATKYTINFNQTTRFLERGDYLRVRNLQLGYTLPGSVTNNLSLRFYVGVTNLFTITGYKGLDPESLNDLPIPRTVNFGISLNL